MFGVYVPQRRGEASSVLRSVGADWALDPSVTAMGLDVIEGGPDGGGGLLVYFDRRGRLEPANVLAAIDLEAQEWQPAAPTGDLPAGRYWLGVWKSQRPGPEDLQREEHADGIPLELRDGRQWVVPIADYLPKMLRLNRATGQQEERPSERHAEFIRRANELFRLLIGDGFQESVEKHLRVVIPDGLRFAADALAINYRVNLDLLDMLAADGIVGEWEAVKIAAVATGVELLASTEKKSALLALKSCND